MVGNYTISELGDWDARIREKATGLGLSWFPQEFQICDHLEMLGAMAYSGMPAHYPHWSFGKSYEKAKTLYDYGVTGLPYEMVINTNPSIAYLMSGNSLCLQILTIAHVYGHNDFFKNNFTFAQTEPEHRLNRIKLAAERVRSYIEDPSVGIDAVENILDSAHAVAHQRRRNIAIRKLDRKEQEIRALERATVKPDPFESIHRKSVAGTPDLQKAPLEPEEDLLLLIRDHNPKLDDWQRDLLTIVHDEAGYFIPQIETKIINEGWATFCHREILSALELSSELHLEFLVRHNQVVRPIAGEINPYHIGLKIWDSLKERFTDEFGEEEARDRLLQVREVERDTSFLRRFLTEELMREMDIFTFAPSGKKLVVKEVSDEENWLTVKQTLIRNVGAGSIPIIRATDIDHKGTRTLYLVHEHDGRDLHLQYAEHTLAHLRRLWMRDVALETTINGEKRLLTHTDDGLSNQKTD
ncbi:MAG: SpoVR family protein [Sphingomonadales bacterium]